MRQFAGFGILLVSLFGAACPSAARAPLTAGGEVGTLPALAPAAPPHRILLPPSPLSQDQQILHILNRLGYGPRPGDVERVRQMGLATYIERQLDPLGIPDPAVEQALTAYPTLAMSSAELVREYPRPAPELANKLQSGEMTPQEIMEAFPPERRPYRIIAEMQAAKITRAVLSERQLQEVMMDFWFNHFNVFAQKGPVRWMLPAYDREAIRPHALGRFKELVTVTARHPAMLFYLDNWLSTRADFVPLGGPDKGRKLGLNENYARELMELHTLGVDGGYTQQDVIEVARCFTGWTIDRPNEGGGFLFRPLPHDTGEKRVLGHVIPAGGGESDGLRVLEILVRHPSTARFIATKLARRFVSDEPPSALIERAAVTFRRTDGDIRAVLATIFTSPEFFSAELYRAKIKTPLEVVASAVRAVGGELDLKAGGAPEPGGAFALARQVAKLGEALYEAQPPTGYPDRAEGWVNTGALLGRMNFALSLTENRLPGTRVDLDRAIGGADRARPEQVLERLVGALLHGEVTRETRSVLAAQLGSPEITRASADDLGPKNTDVEKLAALVLGSPEFQRR